MKKSRSRPCSCLSLNQKTAYVQNISNKKVKNYLRKLAFKTAKIDVGGEVSKPRKNIYDRMNLRNEIRIMIKIT
jgi:hypothetical protein